MDIIKIKSNRYKTKQTTLFISTKYKEEDITKLALLPMVLRRGTEKYNNQLEISKKLEELYGADLSFAVMKKGEYYVIRISLDTLEDKYVDGENILEQSLDLLDQITKHPYLENGAFKADYVNQEKEVLKTIIKMHSDEKISYAFDRCIEEMTEDAYGKYKYGTIEELEKIDEKNLYEFYKEVFLKANFDCYIIGNFEEETEKEKLEEVYVSNTDIKVKKRNEVKTTIEKLDVTQGKLNMGFNIDINSKKDEYAARMLNYILGGTGNSKLFLNVREKAGLAYIARSNYVVKKDIIIVSTGIEIENYEKAKELILKQIEDIKNGNITEEEMEDTRTAMFAALKDLEENPSSYIQYLYSNKLQGEFVSLEDYKKAIANITKEDIINVANTIKSNNIYFLRNED